MMKVTLIRHTSVAVPRGVCYGQTDVPLSDTFKEEASLVSAALNGRKFDRVFTSPLSRCTRLAVYCGYAGALRDDRLKELNFGEWEMQRFDDITDLRIQAWYTDYLNIPATGGESFMMQYARVASFLDELKQQDFEQVAVFTHGGVLACARVYACEVKAEDAFNRLQPYGAVIEISLHHS